VGEARAVTAEAHQQRHVELHRALDELVADWITHGPGADLDRRPSERTIMELMKWSYRQTVEPDHKPGRE
jgi:hypothetical protein